MTTVWLDTETFLLQPGLLAPPIVCLQYAVDDGPATLVHVRDPRFNQAMDAILEPGVKMVAHNGAGFEFLVFLAHEPKWRKRLWAKLRRGELSDTMIREKLLRIGQGDRREGFGLDDCLAAHNIPVKLDKQSPWRTRYGSLYSVPVSQWPQAAVDYALGDVHVREVWRAQEAKGERFYVNEHAQVEAAVALALSSAWGLRTDPKAAAALEAATLEDIKADKRILAQAGLLKFDGKGGVSKDKKKAEELLIAAYAKLGKEAPRGDVTDKMKAKGLVEGNVKLDEEACLKSKDPVLAAYTRFGQANTLLSKVRRLKHPLIQPSYNILVDSGRTSCRQGEDPKPGEPYVAWGSQVQNPPRDEGVRECYVARPGKCKVSIDFDTFELRTWTQANLWLIGYSDMLEVLKDPARDVHVELGAAVYGISIEEAYALKKTDKAKYKDLRQVAKALNFGAPGGLGAKTFVEFARSQYGLFLDLDDEAAEQRARELIAIWKRKWREAGAYLDFVADQLGKRGARTQLCHLGSNRLRGDVGYCDYANSLFQGLASDAAKAGFVALMYAMYDDETSPIYGCRMLAFIHDEVILEVLMDRLHEAAHVARDIFVAGAQAKVPNVPLTASPAAFTRWSKKYGDPVYNASGRLIPGDSIEAA